MQSECRSHVTRRNFVRSWLENWAEWQTADARGSSSANVVCSCSGRFRELSPKPSLLPATSPDSSEDLAQLSRAEAQAGTGPAAGRAMLRAGAAHAPLEANPEAVASPDVGEHGLPAKPH